MYSVLDNKLFYNKVRIKNPAVIYDNEVGTVIKHGDAVDNNLDAYYTEFTNKLNNFGLNDISKNIVYIKFNDMNMDLYDVRTLMNFVTSVSAIPGKLDHLLNLPEEEFKAELNKLRIIEF